MLAALRFLHGNMFHRVVRRCTMPMLLARRNPHGVAGADFAHGSTPGLYAANSGHNSERLPKRVRVPCGARPRLETHPSRSNARGIRRLDYWILPYGPREARRPHLARRPRSASNNVHGLAPPNPAVVL